MRIEQVIDRINRGTVTPVLERDLQDELCRTHGKIKIAFEALDEAIALLRLGEKSPSWRKPHAPGGLSFFVRRKE